MEVLLVEDNPGDARLLEEFLHESGSLFTLKRASRLSDAMECIAANHPEVVLLDLGLPDSQGLATLRMARKAAPEVPVVIMTGLDDKELGVQAIKEGAQDYLVKGRVSADELARSLRYATERQRMEQALLESEARYRALAESIPPLIWTCTPEGQCDYLNQKWVAYTGIPEQQQLGYGWLEQIHPGDREQLLNAWNYSVASGCDYNLEYRIRRFDGEYRWFKSSGVPLRDTAGKIVKWFGSNTDVQSQKDVEAELEQKRKELAQTNEELACVNEELTNSNEELTHVNKELARSNEELAQFAYVASHDLQEPLRKILAFGDRLSAHAGEKLDNQGRNYLQRMQNAAVRMGQLIDSLLELSRVATRGAAFESLNLNKVLPEVLNDLDVLLLKVGGRVEIAHLPTLMGDRAQMCQLFQNLIINALKFHRQDVPPVVHIFSRKGPDKFWELHVADNGIGFEEQYVKRIFQPFQRLNPRGEYEGSGMGLAICQKIVARHGGQITAHSQPGAGSDFVVTLPAAAHLSKEAKAS